MTLLQTTTKKNTSHSTHNVIDEAGKESFPSSDPPAWTLGSNQPVSSSKEDKSRDIAYILTEEHAAIRRVTNAIEKMIKAIQNGKSVDREALSMINQFFIHYVDKVHCQKEELIFAAMHQGEERPSDYILHDLHSEHEHGKQMHANLEKWLTETKGNDGRLIMILKDIVNLHCNHIAKEEEYVFPLISKVIDSNQRDIFLSEFQRIEKTVDRSLFENLALLTSQIK